MQTLFELSVSNLVMAGLLSIIALILGLVIRRPAFVHGLWLLVFLKLITPPIVWTPIYAPVSHHAEKVEPQSPGDGKVQVVEHSELPTPVPVAPIVKQPAANVFLDPKTTELFKRDVLEQEPVKIQNQSAPAVSIEPISTSAVQPETEWNWRAALMYIWLTGTIVWFSAALLRLMRFQRLLRFAKPAGETLQLQTQTLADSMGVRCPSVRQIPGVLAPMVWVFGRRRLLLVPTDLCSRLSPEQTATMLAHELAHLRRRDHWVRWLEMLVLGLYWWCPLIWWARGRLRQAEEECCDAWVVWTLPTLAKTYACTLMETVDFLAETRLPLPIGASGFGQVQQLKRRLTMIMQGKTPRTLKVTGFVMLLGLAGLLLPLAPGFAERPGGEKEKAEPEASAPGERPSKEKRNLKGERDEKKERKKGDGEKRERPEGKEIRGFRGGAGELREWAIKLERMKRELDEQRRLLEEKARAFELQYKRFRDAQKRAVGEIRNPFADPTKPDRPSGEEPRFQTGLNPAVMDRLGELEKQLHRILMEIHQLRKHTGGGPRQPRFEQPKPQFKPWPGGIFRQPPKADPEPGPRPERKFGGPLSPPRQSDENVPTPLVPQPELVAPLVPFGRY